MAFLRLSKIRRPEPDGARRSTRSRRRARTSAAASRATSVPRPPMAMPMSAAFSAGRIVDAVAGHGDDLAVSPGAPHDPQLLLRDDAREDVDGLHALGGARRRSVRRAPSPSARRRSPRRPICRAMLGAVSRMIAGDHHDADARRVALGDGVRDASAASGRPARRGRRTRRRSRAARSAAHRLGSGRAPRRARAAPRPPWSPRAPRSACRSAASR